MDLADQENEDRDPQAIAELLKQLAELRELDRRRQAHAPGSAAHDRATLEVDLRSRRLMDAFRDLEGRQGRGREDQEAGGAVGRMGGPAGRSGEAAGRSGETPGRQGGADGPASRDLERTRRVDARGYVPTGGSARLN